MAIHCPFCSTSSSAVGFSGDSAGQALAHSRMKDGLQLISSMEAATDPFCSPPWAGMR